MPLFGITPPISETKLGWLAANVGGRYWRMRGWLYGRMHGDE